jgi:hypothetical protein
MVVEPTHRQHHVLLIQHVLDHVAADVRGPCPEVLHARTYRQSSAIKIGFVASSGGAAV